VVAAAVTGAVAVAMACTPVGGPAAPRIMGKLTSVANRIVDRGELYLCPV
jgi:hypothetical protein